MPDQGLSNNTENENKTGKTDLSKRPKVGKRKRVETEASWPSREGESVVELVEEWHHGINDGREPAEVIVFYAGEVGTPLSVERP